MAGIYSLDKYKSNIELLFTCNLTLSIFLHDSAQHCMLRLFLMGCLLELLWLGKCCQKITMMIPCLLKRDFKPISRQVKAADNIGVCLWSFQGVNSVCPQKFGHPLESGKVFFNWLVSNSEVNWAVGWLASATAKPEENSLEHWKAYGTLWLMGNITLPCSTQKSAGHQSPGCRWNRGATLSQAGLSKAWEQNVPHLSYSAEPNPSLYMHYSILMHCMQRPRKDY